MVKDSIDFAANRRVTSCLARYLLRMPDKLLAQVIVRMDQTWPGIDLRELSCTLDDELAQGIINFEASLLTVGGTS